MAGRGAVWLAHLNGVQGVAGSNPAVPIILRQAQDDRPERSRRAIRIREHSLEKLSLNPKGVLGEKEFFPYRRIKLL